MSQFALGILICSLLCAVAQAGIVTKGRTISVRVGEEVVLPCVVENDEDQVVIWSNKNGPLYIDGEADTSDERMMLANEDNESNNHSLILRNVESFDDGNFTCRLGEKEEIVHRLLVTSPPSVKISPTSIAPCEGEDVVVRCTGSGNPRPKIQWRKLNGDLPSNADAADNGELRLPKISSSASGTYECEANNGVKATARVEISVNAKTNGNNACANVKPTIMTDKSYVPVSPGDDVELECRYNGTMPQVDWFFNAITKIDKNKYPEFAKYEHNYSVTTLVLKNITTDNFGTYSCRVSNNLGHDERNIYVSGQPGPPVLVARNGELSWTVESKRPVMQYKVLYRLKNEDTWRDHQVYSVVKQDQHGQTWHRTVKLSDFLKPGNTYELQVQAVNELGEGSLAANYVTETVPGESAERDGNVKLNAASTAFACLPLMLSGLLLRLL